MNMKKKPKLLGVLRAACVILFYIGVPIWLFMGATVVDALWLWVVTLCYVWVVYFMSGRFGDGGY